MPTPQRFEPGIPRYRPDIDGLRAIAILTVLSYHYGVPGFGGGFAGVDIFFVISGFLIARLLQGELETGSFSLAGFYERRIRRIFPALFVMMAAVALVVPVLFMPFDLSATGVDLAATAFSISNLRFWFNAGYFAPESALRPLLHTWSLGIEEQFYLVFPPLLYIAREWRASVRLAMLGAGAALSFALFAYTAIGHPQANFYFSGARAWELLMGVILALAPLPDRIRGLAGAAGAALVAVAVAMPLPFFDALRVRPLCGCLGAALLIHAGTGAGSWTSRALSWRPLVFVGLISYSLYLWHWPLLVFASYWAKPGPLMRLVLALLSFLLAWLSWRFVERPFRLRGHLLTRQRLFAGAAACMLLMAGSGVAAWLLHGLPQRFPAPVRAMLTQAMFAPAFSTRCLTELTESDYRAGRFCTAGQARVAPSVAVWGDSHAAALMPAFEAGALRHRQRVALLAATGCMALTGDDVSGLGWRCSAFNTAALRYIRAHGIRTVALAAWWIAYKRGEPAPGQFAEWLSHTVAALSGAGLRVFIVSDVPEPPQSVPPMLAWHMMLGRRMEAPTLASHVRREKDVLDDFARLSARHQAWILDPALAFCGSGACKLAAGDVALYHDNNHVSVSGALQLAGVVDPVFSQP